jgi:hypothetical protein
VGEAVEFNSRLAFGAFNEGGGKTRHDSTIQDPGMEERGLGLGVGVEGGE